MNISSIVPSRFAARWIFRGFTYVAISLLSLADFGRAAEFIWGVCAHPGTDTWKSYRDISRDQQLDLLVELGAKHMRVGEAGFPLMDELLTKAESKGVEIHPILHSPLPYMEKDANGAYVYTNQQIYDACYDEGAAWAARYLGRISTYELMNEVEAQCIISGTDGSLTSHYDTEKYEKCLAAFLGLSDGVRSADPSAKRMVGTAGWYHYGFIDRLIADGVDFEILAWHWYSNMGSMTRVLSKLKSYGKPIWITEIDREQGSQSGQQIDQANKITGYAHELKKSGAIEAFFVYALFDEPYLSSAKSRYGLVATVNPTGPYVISTRKPSFYAYQQAIAELGSVYAFATDMVVDNSYLSPAVSLTGSVSSATIIPGFHLFDYFTDDNTGKGTKEVVYRPWLPYAGDYEVYVRWPATSSNAPAVPIVIKHAGGTANKTVNQQLNGNTWVSLGGYSFPEGQSPSSSSVLIRNAGTSGTVTADAVRFRKISTAETENLAVLSVSGGTHATTTDTGMSSGKGTSLSPGSVGGHVVYQIPNVAPGTYLIKARVKKLPNRAICQLAVANHGGSYTNVGVAQDLYSAAVSFTELSIGTWTTTTTSTKNLRFTITGKNASSTGYTMVFDYFRLVPQ